MSRRKNRGGVNKRTLLRWLLDVLSSSLVPNIPMKSSTLGLGSIFDSV
jgi:hypothetical protein